MIIQDLRITGPNENPSFSTWKSKFFKLLDSRLRKSWIIIQVFSSFWKSWIIKSKNLDFHFDNPRFSTYCTEQVKNLGSSTENPSFSESMSNNLKNLDFQVEKLVDNPRFSKISWKTWIINWKSKFFLKILDYQMKILDYQPIIQDFQQKSRIFE